MRADIDRALRDLGFKTPMGLVTRTQLQSIGCPPELLRRRVRAGEVTQVELDVFCLSGVAKGEELPWSTRALAACMQRGPEARVGFHSAAKVWGLADPGPLDQRIHVVVPMRRKFRHTESVVVHHSRYLPTQDGARFGKVPVTTVARTLLDLAGSMTRSDAERLVDDALVRGLTTVPLLSAATQRNARRGCMGAPLVRCAMELWIARPLESHAETRVLRWLLHMGVPAPVCQLEIMACDKRFRVDLAWPASQVVLEVDGFAHHHGPRKLSADHERRSALTSAGWRVLTTTTAEVQRGGDTLLTALRALGVHHQ